MIIFFVLSVVVIIIVCLILKKNGNKQSIENEYKPVSRSGMKEAKYSGNMFTGKCVESGVKESNGNIQEDFLGVAAQVGLKAKKAMKLKNFDEAWGLFQEQKFLYMKHANQAGFSAKQALALDSKVHEDMANILRQEGKHNDALVHIVYWVLAGSEQPKKRHDQKLQTYFNRCKSQKISFETAKENMNKLKKPVNFLDAKSIVSDWVDTYKK